MGNKIIIKAKWLIETRKYYESHGYVFTNYEDLFEVNESDFNKHSKMKVFIQCQSCGCYFETEFRNYYSMNSKSDQIFCKKCIKENKGEPFLTSLRNFTQHDGQVCSNCKNVKSLGERRIQRYLENKRLDLIPQKWFVDCRDANPLPFDFYLDGLNTIIEFDGRQHFEETGYFTYPLEIVQKHDKIKNIYCREHNINLIRISYLDYNKIEEILDKELSFLHEDIV